MRRWLTFDPESSRLPRRGSARGRAALALSAGALPARQWRPAIKDAPGSARSEAGRHVRPSHGAWRHDHGRRRRQRRNGFDPTAMLTDWETGTCLDAARRPHAAHLRGRRPRTRRSRSRRASCSRPGPTTAACPGRRCGPKKASGCGSSSRTSARTRTRCISTASMRRGWTACRAPALIDPGEEFVYEFDAKPFGCHLYHCHALPLQRHMHKGMYGALRHRSRSGPPPRARRGRRARAFSARPRTRGGRKW